MAGIGVWERGSGAGVGRAWGFGFFDAVRKITHFLRICASLHITSPRPCRSRAHRKKTISPLPGSRKNDTQKPLQPRKEAKTLPVR